MLFFITFFHGSKKDQWSHEKKNKNKNFISRFRYSLLWFSLLKFLDFFNFFLSIEFMRIQYMNFQLIFSFFWQPYSQNHHHHHHSQMSIMNFFFLPVYIHQHCSLIMMTRMKNEGRNTRFILTPPKLLINLIGFGFVPINTFCVHTHTHNWKKKLIIIIMVATTMMMMIIMIIKSYSNSFFLQKFAFDYNYNNNIRISFFIPWNYSQIFFLSG